jgi:hypothetical protein
MDLTPETVSSGPSSAFDRRALLLWAAIIASLAAVFGPALLAHFLLSLSPRYANNDALQQIYPFFRYEEPGLFPRDAIADYYLACIPWGYKGLFMLAARFGGTVLLSKLMPYAGMLVMLVCIAATAQRLAGKAGALVALALSLGTSGFEWRIMGGLPRSFAYPVLGLAMAALAFGRLRALAVLVPIAAAFYPVSAVVSGLALALCLLGLPAANRGDAATWSLGKRVRVLALSGGAALLVLVPTALSSRVYGEVIRPADAAKFPEAGPRGRYIAGDRAPFDNFFNDAQLVVERVVRGDGAPLYRPWSEWAERHPSGRLANALCVFALGGLAGFMRRRQDARRIAMLALAALIGHTLAIPLAPYFYLPQRYATYPIGVLAPVLVATAAAGYLGWLPQRFALPRAAPLAILLVAVPLLMTFGGRGSKRKGLQDQVQDNESVFAAIAALPNDAVIAGWPGGPLNSIPYLSRRAVLLNRETHQAFHTDFTLEQRRRMDALIDAYFGTSIEPLVALRDRFGVTHMLIDWRHFEAGTTAPTYFEPFGGRLLGVVQRAEGQFELPRQVQHGQVLNSRFVLLDLHRLQK